MRNFTIVVGLCVAVTLVLAAPPSQNQLQLPRHEKFSSREFHNVIKSAKTGRSKIKSIISLRYLQNIAIRDSFSDLIESELGKSATAFLEEINSLFNQVNQLTSEGEVEMDKAMGMASLGVRVKINIIKTNAIEKIFEITQRFIVDLGRVLLGMPNAVTNYDPIADKIRAILCKTLQQFVENILRAFEETNDLLTNATISLLDLAEESGTSSEVASILNEVANKHLSAARRLVSHMIDTLRNLLSSRMGILTSMNSNNTEKRDLFDETVLEVLGFSAQIAAVQAEDALSELAPLIMATREELIEALSDDSEVQTKVMDIYDSSMNNLIEDVKPVYTAITDLQGSGCDGTYIYNLMGSLPGVGMEYFKPYLKQESNRTITNLKKSHTEIENESALAGPEIAMRVSRILHRQKVALQNIVEPLVETLMPVLVEPEAGKEIETVQQQGDDEEENWLEKDGQLYNRDALIMTVSNKLGFPVDEAAVALKASLENVDSVMGVTLSELDIILTENNVDLHSEILGIMNNTLIGVHVAAQPMLNVLLPFLPDGFRSNQHIALDIFNGIKGVDPDDFLIYCSAAVKEILRMNHEYMEQIREAANKASPETNEEITALIEIAQQLTRTYIMPFIEIIKPIISGPFNS